MRDTVPSALDEFDPAAGVAAVRRAIEVLVDRNEPAVTMVAHALAEWLARPISLDDAMFFEPGFRTEYRRAAQRAAIRWMARQYFPGMKIRPAAHEVWRAVSRYETTSWSWEKMPQRPEGIAGAAHDVLAQGSLPSEETIRRILSGSSAC